MRLSFLLAFATLATAVNLSAQESSPAEKTAPTIDPGALGKNKDLRDAFYFDFRDGRSPPPLFTIRNRWMRAEPEGLLLAMPAERGHVNAVELGFLTPVKGDFEITAAYQILRVEAPTGGFGVGATIQINQAGSKVTTARVGRVVRAPNREVWVAEHDGSAIGQLPLAAKEGRMRFKRTGDTLRYLVAEGVQSEQFREIQHLEFGSSDLNRVVLQGVTGQQKRALDFRWLDLRIQAEALPELAKMSEALAAAQASRPRGWLAAGLLVGLLVILSVAVLVWFGLRRREGRGTRVT